VPRDDDTGFRPNYYVPIDSVFERKMNAIRELRSQKNWSSSIRNAEHLVAGRLSGGAVNQSDMPKPSIVATL
jgi:hypothetical protein